MNKTLKWILISVGVLLVILVVAKAVGGPSNEGVKVTAEKAARRTIIETASASGKVYPEVEVRISPDISGEITELNVAEGDSVHKGQVLARIYADIYSSQRDEAAARVTQSQATVANSQAGLDALKAQLDQAKTTYQRNKDLYDQKVISQSELDQYTTQLRSTQSQYNAALQNIRSLQAGTQSSRTSLVAADKNLSRTTLTAPMDGVISSLSVKKGERVAGNSFNVGTEMMRVADMNSFEVRVDVGENDIVKVHNGDSADVTIEAYNNRKFKGVVTQIASSSKSSTGSSSSADVTNYEVHIRLDPATYADLIDRNSHHAFPLRPGMNANAEIKTKRSLGVISVPIAAVAARIKGSDKSIDEQKREKKKDAEEASASTDDITVSGDDTEIVVFVVKSDGTVEKRTVTTGVQDVNYIEITGGLKEGETVVTGPSIETSKNLRGGKKVNIVSKDKLFNY